MVGRDCTDIESYTCFRSRAANLYGGHLAVEGPLRKGNRNGNASRNMQRAGKRAIPHHAVARDLRLLFCDSAASAMQPLSVSAPLDQDLKHTHTQCEFD